MSTRPKALSDTSERLAEAFAELDKVGSKLDALKESLNATAKEVASAVTPVPPVPPAALSIDTPVEAIKIPPQAIPPEALSVTIPPPGRYSEGAQKSERPMAMPPRPPIPRPTPKLKLQSPDMKTEPRPRKGPPLLPPMSKRLSGRFYIQVDESEDVRAVREKIAQVGRIVDSGTGTASNPNACWLEIAVRDEDVKGVIEKLRRNDLSEIVEKVIEVDPGEGRIQARQLDLFRVMKAR